MENSREALLTEIKNGLQTAWLKARQDETSAELKKYPDNDAQSSRIRSALRIKNENQAKNAFTASFGDDTRGLKHELNQQYALLYAAITQALLERHPWLNDERSHKQILLRDIFVLKTLPPLMFDLLANKPRTLNSKSPWENILIAPDTPLQWDTFDAKSLSAQIAGFPLSEAVSYAIKGQAALAFYDDRPLPSYLNTPFTTPPLRYDLYRLLKKTYPDKFKSVILSNQVACTQIAPVHYSELNQLSSEEWAHFTSLIVNVGAESAPQWVLLDKKQGHWTLYTPNFLAQGCRDSAPFKNFTIQTVAHAGAEISEPNDWHAVLLSRVLPWCQRPDSLLQQDLASYRSTIPISLLAENALEASCLPAQGQAERASQMAFAKSIPLSASDTGALYAEKLQDSAFEADCLLPDIPETAAHKIIDAFDKGEMMYDPIDDRLTIAAPAQRKEAMKLAYHHAIKRLAIATDLKDDTLDQWFTYNLTITHIESPAGDTYAYMHACAARNRFLEQCNAPMPEPKAAWETTGRLIAAAFQSAPPTDETQLKNIAAMGKPGLDYFFKHLSTVPKPALSCTLDLDCGATLAPADYIVYLADKMEALPHSPLFTRLDLILPDNCSVSVQNALVKLLGVINERAEITAVTIRHANALGKAALTKLQTLADDPKFCLQIKMPEWDNSLGQGKSYPTLKAAYRAVQNTVLKNIHQRQNPALEDNTRAIDKPLPVTPLKTNAVAQDPSWTAGVSYSFLSTVSTGVQQQAQQEVAQQAQQEAEEQSPVKKAVVREIKQFTGREEDLITRDNVRQKHGVEVAEFSLWVGSTQDAPAVIQKMDSAAFEKIKEYAVLFKFGIDWENTPGFRLYFSPNAGHALILTYDKNLEQKDRELPQVAPFTIHMDQKKPAIAYDGDYRQFEYLVGQDSTQTMTAWHHLATETVPIAIKNWLSQNNLNINSSESMQHFDVSGEIRPAEHTATLLDALKKWSKAILNPPEDFLSALFTENEETLRNMQAFGQLFNHYGSAGNAQWLRLAYQVHEKFPGKFALYKQYFLDPLEDWSECLEKEEVEAFTSALAKLANHPVHLEILWALIAAHGDTVLVDPAPRMRFAEIWQAYNKVIDYIDANDLTLNKKEILEAIQPYQGQFNASQFLRRLYGVLQQTGNRQESATIQQEILNNLSKIDWQENGFYYACVHEQYRYWDESLQLSNLQRLDESSGPASYTVQWDAGLSLKDPVGYTLRYAAQRLQLNKSDFDRFKTIINTIPKDPELLRLITASLAVGVDTVASLEAMDWEKLDNKAYASFIKNMNEHLVLDAKTLVRGTYQVPIAHLPVLLEACKEKTPRDLNTLNAFGRALRCYEGNIEKFAQLLAYAEAKGFDDPTITAYPWLVDTPIPSVEDNPEITRFYQQLQSIDFEKSKLPNHETLSQMIDSIHSANDRKNVVSALISASCFIKDQEADFRELTPEEKKLGEDFYLSKTFRKQNSVLIKALFARLAVKEEGDSTAKIEKLLQFFKNLDRKNYYDELGQLLGTLLEQSQDRYYGIEQLSIFLAAVFDEKSFKTKPYPVAFIHALLTDAVQDPNSGLLNANLRKLQTQEDYLLPLEAIMREITLSDLPDNAQKTLVKCAIQYKKNNELEAIFQRFATLFHPLQSSPQVTHALGDFITTQLAQDPITLEQNIGILEQLAKPYPGFDAHLKNLWESGQITLLERLATTTEHEEAILQVVNTQDPSVRMILTEGLQAKDDLALIARVSAALEGLSGDEKNQLAHYYLSRPRPSIAQIEQLLSYKGAMPEKLAYFERVIQAEGKRNYSLSTEDAISIQRVLDGFKLKNNKRSIPQGEQAELLHLLYYTNTFSQVSRLAEKTHEELLNLIAENTQQDSKEAKARVLACMREIGLRKTGIWVNHTQMIDLLYSALHNTDNLLHQIRTGEGKSIVSVMSMVYSALHGEIIDIFSSKESLSCRDHEEFSSLLDAFGIQNSHITANSGPELYHNTRTEAGIGAVHYATIGNWSLFLSGVSWEGTDTEQPLDMRAPRRVAYLDEADHILRSENTLFNYADQSGSDTVYNYDAWVYQEVYDFYTKNKETFAANGFKLDEIPHLQTLYNQLEQASRAIAPDKSSFFKKYLATGNSTLRNQTLVDLVKATHKAEELEEGADFCVMPDQKTISDSARIDTRFAKVMIDNQVYHGSTYSELVQQFLHVCLNNKAIQEGQTPNFFIDPESEIALSLNARYVLKNYYKRIVGLTGTPGDDNALKFYQEIFDIDRVIKIPTHQDIITTFLPPIYSEDEASQVAKIVTAIRENPQQPILITCEDDKAVAHLHGLIQQTLGKSRSILKDTNAAGLSEADIVKLAGLRGAITISARLGRGTNITPWDKQLGLKVIRTYPAIPEIVKQEQGRQGRNHAGGVCQDIINYAHIAQECEKLKNNNAFQALLVLEQNHLAIKLAKHHGENKKIWAEMKENPELQEQYLNTRTLQRFKQQQKEAELQHTRQKDDVIAEGSGQVIAFLPNLSSAGKTRLKQAWKTCKKAIETAWSTDQGAEQSRAILADFYYSNRDIIRPPAAKPAAKVQAPTPAWPETAPIAELIAFYQSWLTTYITHHDADIPTQDLDALDALYIAFQTLHPEQLAALSNIVQTYPALIHSITSSSWVTAIGMIQSDADVAENYVARLNEFFTQSPNQPHTAEDVAVYNRAFIAAVEGVPNTVFLKNLIQDNFEEYEDLLTMVDSLPKQVVDLCKNHMHEEDVLFFLKNIHHNMAVSQACSDYLLIHYQAMKDCPAMMRPAIALLCQNTDMTLFAATDFNAQNSLVLDFLSQRPGFRAKDYAALQAKIERIAEPHRDSFLAHLATLPPYMSVATVLKDLNDLPGKSFMTTQSRLDKRIEGMQEATTAFIDFMFAHNLIKSKDSYAIAIGQEKPYQIWQTIFAQLSLEQRQVFFTTIRALAALPEAELVAVAATYVHNKDTEQLYQSIQALQESSAQKMLTESTAKKTGIRSETSAQDDARENPIGFFKKK